MKNLKLTMRIILAALIIPITSFSQVINGGFENWDSIPFLNEGKNFLPIGWYETNNEFCYIDNVEWSVTRTTDAHTGNYAIQLKNVLSTMPQNVMLMTSNPISSDFNNKIPITGKPNKLEFYYKFTSPGNDTFTTSVFVTNNDAFIGIGYTKKFVQKNEYTKMSLPILYQPGTSVMPDSAVIVFEVGGSTSFIEGSKLLIDDITFGYATGVLEQKPLFTAEVEVWPNPATDEVNISIVGADKKVLIELVNMLGQTIQQSVHEVKGAKINASFNLMALNKGIYFIKVSDEDGARGFRLLHQ